ncbi:CFF_collapsed_G0023180.mRNA.1.CDS.1 [Saccharomyces cerevisiae]|nr:CFF_collapsed_G0023180.mRNA.1.CDS.1 [Saccharomyces cerevisiae]
MTQPFYAISMPCLFFQKYGSLNSNTGDYGNFSFLANPVLLCYMAGEIVGLQITGPSVDYMWQPLHSDHGVVLFSGLSFFIRILQELTI